MAEIWWLHGGDMMVCDGDIVAILEILYMVVSGGDMVALLQ